MEFWQQIQHVHGIVLDKFEARYASVFDTLDKILANNKPSRANLKQLRNHVPANMAI
jgi:hypothetical protein